MRAGSYVLAVDKPSDVRGSASYLDSFALAYALTMMTHPLQPC